jgi:hypothetical protein
MTINKECMNCAYLSAECNNKTRCKYFRHIIDEKEYEKEIKEENKNWEKEHYKQRPKDI